MSGSTWTGNPDDSSNPPVSVASYIGVIVPTQVTQSGGTISGPVAELAVLQIDNPAGYALGPGHSGPGPLLAVAP